MLLLTLLNLFAEPTQTPENPNVAKDGTCADCTDILNEENAKSWHEQCATYLENLAKQHETYAAQPGAQNVEKHLKFAQQVRQEAQKHRNYADERFNKMNEKRQKHGKPTLSRSGAQLKSGANNVDITPVNVSNTNNNDSASNNVITIANPVSSSSTSSTLSSNPTSLTGAARPTTTQVPSNNSAYPSPAR